MTGRKSEGNSAQTDRLGQMAAEASRELAGTRRVRLAAEMKNLARRMLGRKTEEKDLFYWPAGMLALGLAEYGAEDGIQAVCEHVRLFNKKGGKLLYPDDALMGAALIRLPAESEELSRAVEQVYAMVCGTDRDELGSILYRPGRGHTEILADGAGMTAFFLAKYACSLLQKLPEDTVKRTELQKKAIEALELAMAQLYNFSSFSKDPESGLLWHCYEAKEDGGLVRKGLIGWGRAMGWYLMGLSETACTMKVLGLEEEAAEEETEEADTLPDLLERYCEAVFSFQRENGLLPWNLTELVQRSDVFTSVTSQKLKDALLDPENSEDGTVHHILTADSLQTDTSASAMTGYTVLRAVECGLLDQGKFMDRLSRLKKGLEEQTDSCGVLGGSLAECVGFGVQPQRFGNYPWGQGAALAFLARYQRFTETAHKNGETN